MEISQPRGLRSLLYFLFGLCPLLFFTDLTRNPYYTQIMLLNVWVCGCWLLWLAQAWRHKEGVWVLSPLDPALWVIMGWCLLSWGASFFNHPAVGKSLYSEGSKAFIFLIVNTYLVYAAVLRLRDKALFKRLLWIAYAVSAAASLYGVAQYFGMEWIWPRTLNPYGSRPVSTFGNPNFMSSYLVLVLPVMTVDYLFKATGAPRVLLFAAILSSFAALLATLTRSSWAGALVGLGVAGWAAGRARRQERLTVKGARLLLMVMVLLVIFWPRSQAGYSATVIERLSEIKEVAKGGYASATQRFLIWTAAWSMVLDHPFLGKGWGSFELFYPFYQGPLLMEPVFRGLRTHANNAHNEILEYWSQIGTVGLGLVVWLWALFFRLGTSIARRSSGAWEVMLWGFIGGVAGMLVDNMLNVSVHFAVPAFLFWWWVGSVFVLDPSALRFYRVDLAPPGRRAVVGACAFGLVCLMARAVCLWAGEVNFFKGFKLSKAGVDLVSASRHLERAHAWHALEVNNNYELGNVYARLGEKEKALRMYRRALDANAGYDEIYFNRGTMFMQMGRLEEAIVHYRICLAINPMSREAYNALANLYFKEVDRHAEAIEALYLQGVRVFPQDRDMWNNLGYLYTQRKEWEKAAHAYRKALEIDPQFELARRNLAAVASKVIK